MSWWHSWTSPIWKRTRPCTGRGHLHSKDEPLNLEIVSRILLRLLACILLLRFASYSSCSQSTHRPNDDRSSWKVIFSNTLHWYLSCHFTCQLFKKLSIWYLSIAALLLLLDSSPDCPSARHRPKWNPNLGFSDRSGPLLCLVGNISSLHGRNESEFFFRHWIHSLRWVCIVLLGPRICVSASILDIAPTDWGAVRDDIFFLFRSPDLES